LLDLAEEGHFLKSKEILTSLSYFGKNLFKQLTQQVFTDKQKEIFKIIKKGFQCCLNHCNNFNETEYENIIESWVAVWMKFVVKCSEVTLKTYFNILVKWAKLNEEDYGTIEADLQKKILFLKCFNAIMNHLGNFAVNYYSYVYEYYIGFFEDCYKKYGSIKQLGQKRTFDTVDICLKPRMGLHKLILESLSLLFINDQNDFIDVFKFEKLIQPLTKQ